jgi:uncharacterized membrane protein
MSRSDEHAKRPVSAFLAGPYGHPFHPLLVTLPIGAWVGSVVLDVGSRATSGHELSYAARWLIATGLVGAAAAACVGFLDLLAIPTRTEAYRTALTHLSLALTATALFGAGLAWRVASPTDPTSTGQLAVSLAGLIALALAGTLGGRLAYRFGVRVAGEDTQAEAFVHRPPRFPPDPPL